MGLDDFCNTGLVLGLGFSSSTAETQKSTEINQKPNKQGFKFDNQLEKTTMTVSINLEPSLTLSLPCESSYEYDHHHHQQRLVGINKNLQDHAITKVQSVDLYRQDSGGASSFSNVSVKREREFGCEDGETTNDHRFSNSKVSDEDDDGSNGRKKLRLSKAQSALLEECFKQHNTLNPKQKQGLAKELRLRPRQVEVWFQNRRARTKLKQTEEDCAFLKKSCETLTDENRRLKKELQELKAVKLAQPLYMQLPAATLTMCPSCERIGGTVGVGHDNRSKNSLINMATKTHFYNHFPNPSAAC